MGSRGNSSHREPASGLAAAYRARVQTESTVDLADFEAIEAELGRALNDLEAPSVDRWVKCGARRGRFIRRGARKTIVPVWDDVPDDVAARRELLHRHGALLNGEPMKPADALRRLGPRRTTPRARPRGAGRPPVKGASRRSSARSGDSGDEGPSDEPPPPRPCQFPGCAEPAKRKYCTPQHADADRQRRKRTRDRDDNHGEQPTGPGKYLIASTAAGDAERERLRSRVLEGCRCNGHHIELERGWCAKCGHARPEAVAA